MSEWEAWLLDQQSPEGASVDGVACEVRLPVAVVTLSRPQALNALRLAGWRELGRVFTALAAIEELRAVVLRGAGTRAFGAGADISEFPQTRTTAADAIVYDEALSGALTAIMELQRPVLAMVRGLAVGGGCELAAACDVRLAATDARFGIPIGRLGVICGPTEAHAVARLIGAARLKELLFTGRLLDAHEARAIGLVERVAEPDELAAATAQMLDAILAAAPTTIRAAKVMADRCRGALGEADAALLAALAAEAYDGDDLKEGVAAFLEKRPPRFGATRHAAS